MQGVKGGINVPKTIRDRILKDHGLTRTQPKTRKHHIIKPSQPHIDHNKTSKMKYLELKYGKSIEELLLAGSLTVVAKKLGNEVDTSTISKWIKKLKLRYNATNLPVCEDCPHRRPACDLGVCMVLVELELWDLIELKKEELND